MSFNFSSLPWFDHHRRQQGTIIEGRPRMGYRSSHQETPSLLRVHHARVLPESPQTCILAPHLPPDALSPPCHLMLGTAPDDFLGYQDRCRSPWGSSVGASGQSPTYLATTHKNKENEPKGQKTYENKYGWCSPSGHFAAVGLVGPGGRD